MSLHISPVKSMFHEEMDILATDLEPEKLYILNLKYTKFYSLLLRFEEKDVSYESHATFKADLNGHINPAVMAPISGSYSGGMFI